MRILIPTDGAGGEDAPVASHLGRCGSFTVVDEKGRVIETVENAGRHHGGSATPAEQCLSLRPDVVLCHGLGRNAVTVFGKAGVRVMVSLGERAADILHAWQAGEARDALYEEACAGHG
ncbi:NifB/NifX family molybdenum-iron cluster-binding protein [Candidatus Woesearchaeota archaeon]|nr:NifB/NifX family molybdenum-iron cluster-binding protein [Candidatus Woesearchaeota archaeon]